MGDDQRRPVDEERLERVLDQVFALGVQVAGGLVQDQQCRVSGASIEWYDLGTFGGDVFGTDRIYNISSAFDITVTLDWNNDADVDILFADNPATAVVESPESCLDGASGAQPESASCALGAGAWSLLLDLFDGDPPKIVRVTITGN